MAKKPEEKMKPWVELREGEEPKQYRGPQPVGQRAGRTLWQCDACDRKFTDVTSHFVAKHPNHELTRKILGLYD
jgi:ribosomal protein L37AE/L43A